MLPYITESVTYLANLQDPTSDGTLIRLVNLSLAALAIILVPLFAFYLVAKFVDAKGKPEGKDVRSIVVYFVIAQALIGAAAIIANVAASTLGGALGG